MGIGVEAAVTHHHLALVGDLGVHSGDIKISRKKAAYIEKVHILLLKRYSKYLSRSSGRILESFSGSALSCLPPAGRIGQAK
jgi:hypothetical protein